ncbi:MAG TPA: branched-chain amino acid ABC transporter permease, partial [Hyphomicrobiales bacterium]|nr:branched-chain amino acid ABC transporter permease [Hyphomicrobiales bacterium]
MSQALVGRAVLAAVVVALIALPLLNPNYFILFVIPEILIMGLFASSFNLLFGYTGLLSFGHAAYFGTGAYVAGLLMRDLQLDYVWVLFAAPLAAGLLGLVIGWFCVRLNEVYFAMLTLAFGMMVFSVYHQWRSLTGGSDGLSFSLTKLAPGVDIPLGNPTNFYFLTLAVVGLSLFLLYRITKSP